MELKGQNSGNEHEYGALDNRAEDQKWWLMLLVPFEAVGSTDGPPRTKQCVWEAGCTTTGEI